MGWGIPGQLHGLEMTEQGLAGQGLRLGERLAGSDAAGEVGERDPEFAPRARLGGAARGSSLAEVRPAITRSGLAQVNRVEAPRGRRFQEADNFPRCLTRSCKRWPEMLRGSA